jgi:acetyl esterase/lipase
LLLREYISCTEKSILDNCYAALKWVHANSEKLQVDKDRMVIWGESAGGGIAAGVASLARDRGLSPPLAEQILVNPLLDDRNVLEQPDIGDLAIWTIADDITGWGALLGQGHESNEEISCYGLPARATDLTGLPDTFIDGGTLDISRDESLSYATRLMKSGVAVKCHLYPGVGFAPESSITKEALECRRRAAKSF